MIVLFSDKGVLPSPFCTVWGRSMEGRLKYNEYDLKAVKFPVQTMVVAVKCEYPVQTVRLSKATETRTPWDTGTLRQKKIMF